jgi:hypothetical protein
MKIIEIFYSVFWISAISIIWFYTDAFLHYSRLFRLWIDLRLEYLAYIALNPNKYFPDFLSEKSNQITNAAGRFVYKLLSCVFCVTAWLSIFAGIIYKEPIIIGPVYVLSLFVTLQIRNQL